MLLYGDKQLAASGKGLPSGKYKKKRLRDLWQILACYTCYRAHSIAETDQ
jgi:hypothetical protein